MSVLVQRARDLGVGWAQPRYPVCATLRIIEEALIADQRHCHWKGIHTITQQVRRSTSSICKASTGADRTYVPTDISLLARLQSPKALVYDETRLGVA